MFTPILCLVSFYLHLFEKTLWNSKLIIVPWIFFIHCNMQLTFTLFKCSLVCHVTQLCTRSLYWYLTLWLFWHQNGYMQEICQWALFLLFLHLPFCLYTVSSFFFCISCRLFSDVTKEFSIHISRVFFKCALNCTYWSIALLIKFCWIRHCSCCNNVLILNVLKGHMRDRSDVRSQSTVCSLL